jgi:hypothetical protein
MIGSDNTLHPFTRFVDHEAVRHVLEAAGPRGASHEDFVEAGLGTDYIAVLRRLVDDEGFSIRTDFASGQARWALTATALAA